MFNNAMLICFELYPRWVPLTTLERDSVKTKPFPPPPQPNTFSTIEKKGNDVRRTKFVKL